MLGAPTSKSEWNSSGTTHLKKNEAAARGLARVRKQPHRCRRQASHGPDPGSADRRSQTSFTRRLATPKPCEYNAFSRSSCHFSSLKMASFILLIAVVLAVATIRRLPLIASRSIPTVQIGRRTYVHRLTNFATTPMKRPMQRLVWQDCGYW